MTKISELLAMAVGPAVAVLDGIDDDGLDAPTPCAEYDVRALISHLFQVVVNFQALAARQEVDFGTTPDIVTGDWRARFGEEAAGLVAAWAVPGADEGTTGAMGLPARTVGNMVLGDLTVHAWDLARATGQEFAPDRSVLDEIGPALAAMAPMAREAKVFGEPYPVPDGASPNTVQLVNLDGDVGVVFGLGPVCVVGAFRGPFQDLAFDDSWVCALSAWWVEVLGEPSDGVMPDRVGRVSARRGKMRSARLNGERCGGL